MAARTRTISVSVTEETFQRLAQIGTPQRVVEHLIHSAAAGVRRPGSWERGWLQQAFGGELDWEGDVETPTGKEVR